MDTQPKKQGILSFPYVMLLLVNLFQSMAAFMTNTTLPLYVVELGASVTTVGIVTSSFALSALLIRPFAGPAFDSFSRRGLLILSQVLIFCSMFLYGIIDSIPVLIAVRLVHGIGIGCSGPLALSLLSEFLPTEKMASGVSIYTLAQSMGQVIGPATGLYLIDSIGFSFTYFLSGTSVLLAMIGVFFVKEPSRKRLPYQLKLSRMFAPQALGKALALTFLSISFMCMNSYVVLYGLERGVDNMGMFFFVYALCLLGTRPLYGKLADKFGTPRLLVVGVLFFASSYVTLSMADSLPVFLVASVLGSAGFGCCAPLLQSYALASVPVELRGAASNTTYTGLDLGNLLGPAIGGFAADTMFSITGNMAQAYSSMWLIMLIPAFGTLVMSIYWILKKPSGAGR